MKIRLAFSTCPNDTFIFAAIANKLLNLGEFNFDITLTDIQELNRFAREDEVDMVKISYAAYPYVSDNYQMLLSGSALGRGMGPLVVAKQKNLPSNLAGATIAIPGTTTTANFLFSLAYPEATQKREYLFSEIEDAVLSNKVDVGVLIHEGRFTYAHKGLEKIADLGNFWEGYANAPIPLGGIAVRRSLPLEYKQRLAQLVSESVTFAWNNISQVQPYIKRYAQAMQDSVIQKHIDLYVNDYTLNLGEQGVAAVERFLHEAMKMPQYKNYELSSDVFVR